MARACVGAADLPPAVQSLVARRAEGLPFLVEEVLAGLIADGSLVERDGRWDAETVLANTVLADTDALSSTPVPATFADALSRRLSGLDLDSRRVISAAAVLGRRFDWGLLAGVTALPDDAVARALRQGVSLQIFAADTDSFRFRHALTHEAVLAGLLPPERARLAGHALAAIEVAHPGLPGDWCRWPPSWLPERATASAPVRCCWRPAAGTSPSARWPAPSTLCSALVPSPAGTTRRAAARWTRRSPRFSRCPARWSARWRRAGSCWRGWAARRTPAGPASCISTSPAPRSRARGGPMPPRASRSRAGRRAPSQRR